MTKQTEEALKMAVEWFEMAEMDINDGAYRMALPIIKACKEALEQPSVAELNDEYLRDTHVEGLSQPAQEPVAWIVGNHGHCTTKKDWAEKYSNHITALYTHPAPSWQGLSDDEIDYVKTKAIMGANGMSVEQLLGLIVSLTEQALKEKNT